jgi:iron(III) transport system permease protein
LGRALTNRAQQLLLVGLAALVLLGTGFLPLVLAALELPLSGAQGLAHARSTLAAPATWTLLVRSLALAASVTGLALALGVPLAALLAKTDVWGRQAAFLVHAFPMFLPPFLLALGWFHLLGRGGILGTEATSWLLFSFTGVVLVLALAFTPVVTSLVALALRGIDPSFEEAARVVAGPRRVVTRILLPLAWPAAALAALVVFALAFSELGVPMFLRVRSYPAAVFARLGGVEYAPGEAFGLVVPLLGMALGLLGFERSLAARRSFPVLGLRQRATIPLPLGAWRGPAGGIVWVLAAFSVLPIAGLALRASAGGFAGVPAWIGASLTNSVVSAGGAATIIAALGLVVGHGLARGRRGSRLLDAAGVLAFVTPAAVLGVGLISLWNRPVTHAVYGSLAIIVIGDVARYGVVGVRTMAAVVAQGPVEHEHLAAVVGAGYARRLFRIVLPLHRLGLAGAWLLALVFCLRDLETAVLFYPPGREPLPVRIFTLEANGPENVVAALAVVQVALTAIIVAAGAALLRRAQRA